MLLDGEHHTIVGVMPEIPQMGFATDAALWTPFQPTADQLAKREHTHCRCPRRALVLARPSSKPNANSNKSPRDSPRPIPTPTKIWSMHPSLLKTSLVGDTSTPLLILFGAVGFVLLIACANVSNLFLSRGWARRREFAIRSAIGATRGALLRQQLVESTIVALIGGRLRSCCSRSGLSRALRQLLPPETPRLESISVEPGVALFTLAVSLLAALVAGLAPALLSVRDDVNATIKESGASASRSHNFLRQSLVVAEVALALTLVIGASLAVQSFARMLHVDTGFRTDHLVTMHIEFPSFRFEKAGTGRSLHTNKFLPTRRRSPASNPLPQASSFPWATPSPNHNSPPTWRRSQNPDANGAQQSRRARFPPYFRHSSSRRSRFQRRRLDSFSYGLHRRAKPSREKYSARLTLSVNPFRPNVEKGKFVWGTIIGVCGDVRERDRNRDRDRYTQPTIYAPLSQAKELDGIFLAVRTKPNPSAVIAAIQSRVWAIDNTRPITGIKTMEQQIVEHNAEPRSQSMLLAIFGALGLLLAIVGVYGVMSYLVSQQTREIGIRMALGAAPHQVLRMIIAQRLKLTLAGIAIGLGTSFALTRFLRTLLFDISPTDPLTFAVVAILLATVAVAACAIPARRATQVDPMIALRHD